MYTVQSLGEMLYEINPDLPVVLHNENGDESHFNIVVEDDKVILIPTENEE